VAPLHQPRNLLLRYATEQPPAPQSPVSIMYLWGKASTNGQSLESTRNSECAGFQLHKVYRAPLENETRYSPAKCIGCDMKAVSGNPDFRHVSTSFVERQNWTVRTNMRHYTRLSNGFSRKLENHAAAIALNYFAYNFIKIHRTLRMSPAMAAGVTDRLWSVEDLVVLWESYEQRRAERAAA
jgi:hypothetical protein